MTGFILTRLKVTGAGVGGVSSQRPVTVTLPALVSLHLAGPASCSGWCTDSGSTQRQVRCETVRSMRSPAPTCRWLRWYLHSVVAGRLQWVVSQLVVSNIEDANAVAQVFLEPPTPQRAGWFL